MDIRKWRPIFVTCYICIVTFLINIKTHSELSGSNSFSNVVLKKFVFTVIGNNLDSPEFANDLMAIFLSVACRLRYTSVYSISSSLHLSRPVVPKMYFTYHKGSVVIFQ
jgi:hypothetical protein